MPFDAQRVLRAIEALPLGEVRLMEVCGTHTMAIAKSGLRSMLPANVKLLSGPGCPVCVTPGEVIDAVLELAMQPDLIITTYGDMVRVPGSTPGDNLSRRRAMGARVEVVYSPVDAVKLARENPDKEVVFLGVGFETTAPGTAAAGRARAARADRVRGLQRPGLSLPRPCGHDPGGGGLPLPAGGIRPPRRHQRL